MKTSIDCELLYADHTVRRAKGGTGLHNHSYCQLEIVTSGTIGLRTDEFAGALETGDAVLLPTGTAHQFRYDARRKSWVTLKFRADNVRAEAAPLLLGSTRDHILVEALTALVRSGNRRTRKFRFAVEEVLAALLAQHYWEDAPEHTHPLIRRVEERLQTWGGRHLSVQELADALGFSAGHLATEFRRHTGQTLKAHIDSCCADTAARLLQYSDRTISEISDLLGFPTIQSFSRFFRRLRAVSPREFRKGLDNR